MQRRQFLSAALAAGAVSASAGAAEAQAEDIVQRFAATLTAHDMSAFSELFAQDYVNHQFSAAAPPPAGKSARRATLDFFQARVDALPDLRVSLETSLASGDKAAASFLWEGTHSAVYYGAAPSGRVLRFTSCDIFRVAGGKIVEHWGMGDIAGVLKQLKG